MPSAGRVGFAFAIGVAVLACGSIAHAAEGTLTLHRQAIVDRKAVFATVESADIQHARARNGGTVASLSIDEGDQVVAGQKVATIGDPKLVLQLQSLNAKSQSLRAERAQAQVDLDRTEQLFRQKVVAKARLDSARTALQVADRALAAQAATREVVEQQMREGEVLSPGNGRVLKVDVTEGAVVMPGETIATVATGAYRLRLELPERHARFIHLGDPVNVGARGLSPDVHPEAARIGHVVKVYPQLDRGRVVADVAVDGLGNYFVGERTLVTVETGSHQGFRVPAEYLATRFGVTFVRLQDDTTVVVQIGEHDADGVEILSGLQDGDVLVPQDQGNGQ